MLKSEWGTSLDRLFPDTWKSFRFESRPRSLGMLLWRQLRAKERALGDERFPSEGRMIPVKLFVLSHRYVSFERESRLQGMFPTNLFFSKLMTLTSKQLMRFVKISPWKEMNFRLSSCRRNKLLIYISSLFQLSSHGVWQSHPIRWLFIENSRVGDVLEPAATKLVFFFF